MVSRVLSSLVSCVRDTCTNICNASEDVVGVGRPSERFGIVVVFFEIGCDGAFQGREAFEGATADAFVGDLGEEAFHLVEPTGTGRSEVNVVFRVAGEPAADRGSFVRGIVVQNEVNLLTGLFLHRLVQVLE